MTVENLVSPTTSREKLLHALYEAAELEQNLMCTYLYAAFSLKEGEEEGLRPEEAAAVRKWRRAILDVAIDEMGHLVAVWNITSALGAAPRFGRTNFPLDAGYLPAGVVVKLAPFSAAVLQHFVHLERPHGSDEPDGEGFAPVCDVTRTPVAPRLTPAGFDYATVGEFYETVGANLRGQVEWLGEERTFNGDPALQMSASEVDLAGAKPVVDLASALAALDAIIVEGEGAPQDTEGSHFQRFVSIRDEFATLRAANPDFVPAHPSAHNPVLRKPPRPEGRVWLENPETVAVVDLANAAYALTLRLLAASYTLRSPSPDKALYVDVAIGMMRALTLLAERAARLPAGPSNPDCNGGASFTALREAAALPAGPSAWQFYVERIDELTVVAEGLADTDERVRKAAHIIRSLSMRLRDAPMPSPAGEQSGDAPAKGASTAAASEVATSQAVTVEGIDEVAGRDITVRYEGKRCIHARFCVTQDPATFLANVEGPWIRPDASDAEYLASVIRECPSGALSYRRHDGHEEQAPPANLLSTREDGPYAVRAEMVLKGRPTGFRATLCRCGASKNKPFCDKSHKYVGFKATGEPDTRDTPLLEVRDGSLAIDPETNGPLQIRGNLEIMSGTGRTIARGRTARLCRCGGSANKPFCDNTHRSNGFQAD
jgi:CDGSH-type Zn-finger protein/uncharacterized Fe-S cluster protein YjdI